MAAEYKREVLAGGSGWGGAGRAFLRRKRKLSSEWKRRGGSKVKPGLCGFQSRFAELSEWKKVLL